MLGDITNRVVNSPMQTQERIMVMKENIRNKKDIKLEVSILSVSLSFFDHIVNASRDGC